MIFTLEARSNIRLESIKELFNLNEKQINVEINTLFGDLISILAAKGIKYQDLRGALTPRVNRKEIALVFDSRKAKSYSYGIEAFNSYFPIFSKDSCHSVLIGDYIGSNENAILLRESFLKSIITSKEIEYKHHSHFFIVYINNLSNKMIYDFDDRLSAYEPYVGYFNLTYHSIIKDILSTMLVRAYVKTMSTIIMGHEDDRENGEDCNLLRFPFEDYGYKYRSIQSMYYELFLSYKIEREILNGLKSDTLFSLNAITENVLDISDFEIQIDDTKFYKYIAINKIASLQRLSLEEMTINELKEIIRSKISGNYIYELDFLSINNTMKFNIIIETIQIQTNQPIKVLVCLEYIPSAKTLRLITLY